MHQSVTGFFCLTVLNLDVFEAWVHGLWECRVALWEVEVRRETDVMEVRVGYGVEGLKSR